MQITMTHTTYRTHFLRISKYVAALLGTIVLMHPSAHAWEVWPHDCHPSLDPEWWDLPVTMTVSTNTADFPASGWKHAAIDAAIERMNDIPGTDFEMETANADIDSPDDEDGYNSVTTGELGGDLAFTIVTINETLCRIEDVDIIVDTTNFTHADGIPESSGTPYSLRQIILHELGHLAGMAEIPADDYPDTMHPEYPGSGELGLINMVSGNMRTGLRAIYPDSSTGTDVAPSSFLLTQGDVIERNPHNYKKAGPELSKFKRKYCYHNVGTTTQNNIEVRFYWSTDDAIIETTDTGLHTKVINVVPGYPTCYVKELTVPEGACNIDAWVGTIIDYDNDVTESNENNNATIDGEKFHVTCP